MRQVSIAIVGPPDIGKSRFIQEYIREQTGRTIPTDALMKEVHWSDGKDPWGNPDTRTIKCAKIFHYQVTTDIVMYDCPGHIEYRDQILQGLKRAQMVIYLVHPDPIIDAAYQAELSPILKEAGIRDTDVLTLHPRTTDHWLGYNFDDMDGIMRFSIVARYISAMAVRTCLPAKDVEKDAIGWLNGGEGGPKAVPSVAFMSGGKDSLVMLHLLKQSPVWEHLRIVVGTTKYDFPELKETWKKQEEYFGKKFEYVDNSMGRTYEEDGTMAMLEAKADTNQRIMAESGYTQMFAAYRASDEAVRSKDTERRDMGSYVKFSPVFLFSEINIWQYIIEHGLQELVCPLYLQGYRSLGDAPITVPCMPAFEVVEKIPVYLIAHQNKTERDGRSAQDKSVPFAMEKLRDKGFF